MLKTEKVIDLHTHTCYSDGMLTPQSLLEGAVDRQVSLLAITEHDTIDAWPEAHQYIATHNLPVTLIDGIQISTLWQHNEIHIVGLRIDRQAPVLIELIEQQKARRIQRAQKIAAKLAKIGIEDAYQRVKQLAAG